MKRAFTLIELLIVIGIIAILALIAIPNFLQAQIRAKISRILADERTIATAIESYFTDYSAYPYYCNALDGNLNQADQYGESSYLPNSLTTPIAYMTAILTPPFQASKFGSEPDSGRTYPYAYRRDFPANVSTWTGPAGQAYNNEFWKRSRINKCYDCYYLTGWFVHGAYPDDDAGVSKVAHWMVGSGGPNQMFPTIQRSSDPQWGRLNTPASFPQIRYDPTNGATSGGDILRFDAAGP